MREPSVKSRLSKLLFTYGFFPVTTIFTVLLLVFFLLSLLEATNSSLGAVQSIRNYQIGLCQSVTWSVQK